jgi:hypothetical protein
LGEQGRGDAAGVSLAFTKRTAALREHLDTEGVDFVSGGGVIPPADTRVVVVVR